MTLHLVLLPAICLVPVGLWSARTTPFEVSLDGRFGRVEPVAPAVEEPAAVEIASQETPTAAVLSQRFEQAIQDSQALTSAQQLARLDASTEELAQISSPERVAEIGTALRKTMGLPVRARQPATAPPPGPFDIESAQIHDVARLMAPNGRWFYRLVLLDASGRTMDVELTDADEGERLYSLMQKIKSSPLLDQLYRTLAMPLLEQAIQHHFQIDSPRREP